MLVITVTTNLMIDLFNRNNRNSPIITIQIFFYSLILFLFLMERMGTQVKSPTEPLTALNRKCLTRSSGGPCKKSLVHHAFGNRAGGGLFWLQDIFYPIPFPISIHEFPLFESAINLNWNYHSYTWWYIIYKIYTYTNLHFVCKWSFPSMYTPAITGGQMLVFEWSFVTSEHEVLEWSLIISKND